MTRTIVKEYSSKEIFELLAEIDKGLGIQTGFSSMPHLDLMQFVQSVIQYRDGVDSELVVLMVDETELTFSAGRYPLDESYAFSEIRQSIRCWAKRLLYDAMGFSYSADLPSLAYGEYKDKKAKGLLTKAYDFTSEVDRA